jgi:hypothetical protein
MLTGTLKDSKRVISSWDSRWWPLRRTTSSAAAAHRLCLGVSLKLWCALSSASQSKDVVKACQARHGPHEYQALH